MKKRSFKKSNNIDPVQLGLAIILYGLAILAFINTVFTIMKNVVKKICDIVLKVREIIRKLVMKVFGHRKDKLDLSPIEEMSSFYGICNGMMRISKYAHSVYIIWYGTDVFVVTFDAIDTPELLILEYWREESMASAENRYRDVIGAVANSDLYGRFFVIDKSLIRTLGMAAPGTIPYDDKELAKITWELGDLILNALI